MKPVGMILQGVTRGYKGTGGVDGVALVRKVRAIIREAGGSMLRWMEGGGWNGAGSGPAPAQWIR